MQDTRIWMYRANPGHPGEVDGRIFESRGHAPSHEGWVDSPAKIKEPDHGKEDNRQSRRQGNEGNGKGRQEGNGQGNGKGRQGPEVLNLGGLSDDELRAIAADAGVKIDKRWGRARLEQALRDADQ